MANTFDQSIDKIAERLARSNPLPLDVVELFLTGICASGCDRIPLKIRNLAVPFYFAGINTRHVFLANAENCMVSQFNLDELEPIMLGLIEDINSLILAWLDSAEGQSSRELIESANQVASAGKQLPVTLRWPGSNKTRQGHLTIGSASLGGPDTRWICGVETVEGQSVVFRYGVTRLDRAMHDGKRLSMTLKPGTPY